MTVYGGYSDPTRADAARARLLQPLQPCLIEGFLVADPPLNQVVARPRGRAARKLQQPAARRMEARPVPHRHESDIIQTASVLQGRGLFQNVPATRRQGLETGVKYQTER